MDLLQEYSELKKTIDYHMDRYYNQDEPEISDYEYDKLMIRLKEIEKEHPEWVTSDSPSQKIGGTVKREAGVKVTHNVPMLSIEDVFSEDAVCAWIDKVHAMHPDCTFSVETKIDGLSMSLRYVKEADGKLHLQLAETRGDGLIGEDVTANARVVGDVLQVIDLPYDSLELRGEVYMSHEDFEKYNEEQERLEKKTAANPRNLAAGTLRQLDTSITKKRGLKMFIFNVQDGPDEIMESHGRGMDILKAAGVPVVYHKICKTKEEVVRAIDEIGRMREELPYDIDGAVVKIDHIAFRQEFPAGSKYSSGHIAYKYPPEEKVIVMDDILVDVGRTGKLTFTGIFHDPETGKPARLCGTSVSRATLHNQDYITQMNTVFDNGYALVTSYRNSKNYSDNWITSGYGLWFLREARYLNNARMILGSSCLVSGTGFLVHKDIINRNNGWNCFLLTEDIQFSTENIIRGDKIGYCADAMFYDEQPVRFIDSWNQRLRWSKGFYQVFFRYGKELMKKVFTEFKFSCYDMFMTLLPGLLVTAAILMACVSALIVGDGSGYVVMDVLKSLAAYSVVASYISFFVMGLLTTLSEWKRIYCSPQKKIMYLFTFPLFMFTYLPISIVAVFKKINWKPIPHSVVVSANQIKGQ